MYIPYIYIYIYIYITHTYIYIYPCICIQVNISLVGAQVVGTLQSVNGLFDNFATLVSAESPAQVLILLALLVHKYKT